MKHLSLEQVIEFVNKNFYIDSFTVYVKNCREGQVAGFGHNGNPYSKEWRIWTQSGDHAYSDIRRASYLVDRMEYMGFDLEEAKEGLINEISKQANEARQFIIHVQNAGKTEEQKLRLV